MKKKTIYFIIAVVLIISAMMLAYIYPFAKSEPVPNGNNSSASATTTQTSNSNIESSNKDITVSSAEELRKISLLGGTNSEIALKENPGLGIAKEFSVFAEGDVTFIGADTEGKVAAGGGVYGQATKKVNGETIPYQYQIGMNNLDEYSADIIVGNGPVKGIALDYGYSDDGLTQTEDNKLIAYSSTASNMNLDNYTDEEKEHFVEADLIDFKSEFERLRRYSQDLVNSPETGEVIDGNLTSTVMVGNSKTIFKKIQGAILYGADMGEFADTGFIRHYSMVNLVLKGTNPDCNVFNLSSKKLSGNIILDVPYNSKVIINQLDSSGSISFGNGGGLYYPLSENKLSEIDLDNQRVTYVAENRLGNDAATYIRDEQNNLKAFIKVGAGYGNGNQNEIEDLPNNILINFPNANKLSLDDVGACILAPNAEVETIDYEKHTGYLFGTLVCKSYIGNNQIYGKKENVTRKYKVNVSKIDKDLKERIANAELELYDSNGNLIHTWSSSLASEKIELDIGTYIIKEKKAPENYISNSDEITFRIDTDGYIYNEKNEKIATADITFMKSYKEKSYVEHEQKWDNGNTDYTCTVQENSGIDFDGVTSKVVNNEYTTSDGGKIVVDSSRENLVIPASETVDNKEIKYEVISRQYTNSASTWDMSYRTSIIKYNAEGKVQWATSMQPHGNNSISMGDIIESENKIIICGSVSGSHMLYANETQTSSGKEIMVNGNSYPGGTPTIIVLDKNGKIKNITQMENQYGSFDKVIIQNDQIYAELKTGTENKVIKIQNAAFPYTWEMLYNGLDSSVGNIFKISFDVDTSNATKRISDDLFMIVAENNGRFAHDKMGEGNNWVEFKQWQLVSNGQNITTTIPIVEELYPYYNTGDKVHGIHNIKLQPHFYRQSADENSVAEEVFDIDVKNVTAHWKEVQYTTKTRQIAVSLENEEPIIIPNTHISTTIKITKVDSKDKKQLSGAVFGVYNKDNNELLYTSEKTDSKGTVTLADLKLNIGTYYIKEITAPKGYELSSEIKEFTVTETSSQEFVFENTAKPVVTPEPEEPTPEQPKEEQQKPEQPTPQESKEEPKQVQTGDTVYIALMVLGIAVTGCGATFALKEYYK